MTRHLSWLFVPVLLLSTGCFNELRGNSRNFLNEQQSSAVIPQPLDQVERNVMGAFARRGVTLDYRRPVSNGRMLVAFFGNRQNVQSMAVYYGYYATSARMYNDSISSEYYAILTPRGPSETELHILGKPVVDNRTVCTASDADFGVPCNGVSVGYNWGGYNLVTGQDEANVVRSVISELTYGAPSGPQGAPPPPTPGNDAQNPNQPPSYTPPPPGSPPPPTAPQQ